MHSLSEYMMLYTVCKLLVSSGNCMHALSKQHLGTEWNIGDPWEREIWHLTDRQTIELIELRV